MARAPMSLHEVIAFQSVSSAVFSLLKHKGLSDEQIDAVLDRGVEATMLDFLSDMSNRVDEMANNASFHIVPPTMEWMTDVANRAVEANLTEEGEPQYDSSQGYACAMSALQLAFALKGETLGIASQADIPETDDRKAVVLLRARNLFHVTKQKYGPESAAKAALDYVAEQNGIADIEALNLTPEELSDVKRRIILSILGHEENIS